MCRWLAVTLLMLTIPAPAIADVSSITRDFFRQPVVERMRTFRTHPLDVQLALFLYGNQKVHPPAQYLADCFALSGPDGVTLLRERLGMPGSDLDIRDMAMLLETMQAAGTYDVRHDAQLMGRLSERIATMRDQGWKSTALSMLKRIETAVLHRPASVSQCAIAT